MIIGYIEGVVCISLVAQVLQKDQMPKVCSNGLQNLKLTAKKEKGMQELLVRGVSRCLKPKKKHIGVSKTKMDTRN